MITSEMIEHARAKTVAVQVHVRNKTEREKLVPRSLYKDSRWQAVILLYLLV